MFPVTISVHNASQLHAVLRAMQPHLQPSDFVDPAIAAAYTEVNQSVARMALADIQAAAAAATPLPVIDPPITEVCADLQQRIAADAKAAEAAEAERVRLAQAALDEAADAKAAAPAGDWTWPGNPEDRKAQEVAAAQVDPPAHTPAVTAADKPARGRRTAAAVAETAAPAKTAVAQSRTAASAEAQSQASTAASDVAIEEVPPLVSYEDVKKQILEVSKTKGRDAAVQLLGQFGAAKGPDLKPEQFGSFLEAARKVLA